MIEPQKIFEDLKQKDADLIRKSTTNGIKNIVNEGLQLSREMARNYDALWKAGMVGCAEQLRGYAQFWALRYEQVTGKEEIPQIPRYVTIG